jgi:hypothetical protein
MVDNIESTIVFPLYQTMHLAEIYNVDLTNWPEIEKICNLIKVNENLTYNLRIRLIQILFLGFQLAIKPSPYIGCTINTNSF